MLRTILGKPGTGKTEYIRNCVAKAARDGIRTYLIVPEQFSFESERALSRRLGEEAFERVEVLSFTSLCNRIFREYGGLAGNYLSGGGKYILMDLAIEQMREQMKVYARQAYSPAFTQSLCRTVSQLKTAGISPKQLVEQADALEDELLLQKTQEIGTIYGMYEALLERGFADPDDDLTRAEELLKDHPFFEGMAVYFDAFDGFTGQEYRIIRRVFEQADEVGFSLCVDKPEDDEHGMGIFSAGKRTLMRLMSLAREAGMQAAPPVVLKELHRAKTEGMRQVVEGMFTPSTEAGGEELEEVRAASAKDPYEEMEYVASEIERLVREQGYRYREIAMITRGASGYFPMVRAAFLKRGIPVFLDERRKVDAKPLFQFCSSALKIACMNFAGEDVLRLLKTGLIAMEPEEIALLEDYSFRWNLRGSMWKVPFQSHPKGFGREMTPEDRETLSHLNLLRERIIPPLEQFRRSILKTDGAGIARALYRLLTDFEVSSRMAQQALNLKEQGEEERAGEYEATWDILMEVLDQLVFATTGNPMKPERFYGLFQLVISEYDMGVIPQTLDQVLLGEAGHVRLDNCRAVFLIGANEGHFPLEEESRTLFTEDDAAALEAVGISLFEEGHNPMLEETYYAYTAVASAQERMVLTCPAADVSGWALLPSVLFTEFCRLFPHNPIVSAGQLPPLFFVHNERTALEAYASRMEDDTPLTSSLREFLQGTAYQDTLAHLGKPRPQKLSIRAESAKRLYGRRLKLSPTRIEKFYRCKFAYFCEQGMRIRRRRRAELSPIETGSVIHYALQMLISKYRDTPLSSIPRAQLQREIDRILEEYLEQFMGGMEEKTARFRYLYRRLKRTVLRLIVRLAQEFDQSLFRPSDFELEISPDSGVPPLEVRFADGTSAQVVGKIDRVDLYREHGTSYLRVIDYKSGNKLFQLSDVYYGLNLQMLLYLFTLWQNGGSRYDVVCPAGVLYMPASSKPVSADRHAGEAELAAASDAQLKMSGIVLDNPEVLHAMEADGKGLFIPVKLKKDGTPDAASSLATLEQMGDLKRHVEKLVSDMARELLEGQIDILPAQAPGGYDLCAYCDYRGVCGIDGSQERRLLDALSRKEVFEKIHAKEEP